MPATELLFGAVYGQGGTIYGGDSDHDIALGQEIFREEIVDYGRKEDKGPKINDDIPEPEFAEIVTEIADICDGLFHALILSQNKNALAGAYVFY